MSNPKFEINIATNSLRSSIKMNGEDISSSVHRVEISQIAGELPVIKIQLVPTGLIRMNAEAQLVVLSAPTEPLEPADKSK